MATAMAGTKLMRDFHRWIIVPVGLVVAGVGVLTIAGRGEATGTGVCYNKGAYSFKFSHVAIYFYRIEAWGVTGCSGSSLVRAEAFGQYYGVNAWDVDVIDDKCDDYGVTVYTHVKSVASGGCGIVRSFKVTFSELQGHNDDFWINWHGVNSKEQTLPPLA